MTQPDSPRRAVLTGHGHPAIRATHGKTFELTAETAITARATCVVAVGTRFDPELARLRGRVRLTLGTDGLASVSGEAVLNPTRAIGERAVIRRSSARDADTLAIESTLTADDLPADFAAALTEPGRQVTLTLEEIGTRRPLVVANTEETPESLRRLLQKAEHGSRVSVEGPQRPVEALLAAGLAPAPSAWLGAPQRVSTLPETAAVFHMPPGTAPEVFAGREVWIEDASELDLGTAMERSTAEAAVAAVGSLVVVGPAPGSDLVDLLAVAQALMAAGISARTLTEALAPFGLTRKKLYALLKDAG